MQEFDVTLSFAGEDRHYAEKLAALLKVGGYSVFYDEFQRAELWGKDLYQYFSEIYKDKARYCVMFLSKYYARKFWPQHELKNAQARAFQENREYILPIRIDDTEIPGILSTVGYLDLSKMVIEEIYEVLLNKLSGTNPQRTTTNVRTSPKGFFQSLDSFELRHTKLAQDCDIYLNAFVVGTSQEESIKALKDFANQTNSRVLLIHSPGGIGKTRLVLESLKQAKQQNQDVEILFNKRQTCVNVEEAICQISEEQESLIVLDDAHLIDNLTDFTNILLERDNAKLILTARSTAREAVKQKIGYSVEEIEIAQLDRESSIELLKGNLHQQPIDEHLRYIAGICEGNPLLIGFSAYLINTGRAHSYEGLKRNDLVKDYFETILAELTQNNQVALYRYEPYLALLYLLKPFSITDDEHRSLVRSIVNIDEVQEGYVLRHLVECAILERHGNTLWVYLDLLGEYLVASVFFSDIPILNFEVTFSKIPAPNVEGVFNTLREVDSDKAIWFLKRWARNLSMVIQSQNNDERSDNLRLLEIIASRVPEETLQIISCLLKPESEKPPETREDIWSRKPQEHFDVLTQCLRILENPAFKYSNFDESLEKLLAMHFYKSGVKKYFTLRQQALNAVTNTAGYDLNLWQQDRGYSIQTRMFGRVREWKEKNLEEHLPLILGVCEKLLETDMGSAYVDSEGIGWSVMPVVVTDDLIHLRKNVIFLLQSVFYEIQDAKQRIDVVRVLNCITTFPSWQQFEKTMKDMIRGDAEILIEFYLRLLVGTTTPEVEVLQEIEEQIHHLKAWHQDDITNLENLLSVLQSHESYQLYRTLLGDAPLFWMDEGKSYDEIQVETAERITEIADSISDGNLIEWSETLSEFAIILLDTSHHDCSRFYQLLWQIGEGKPETAQRLIDRSLLQNNALKRFAGEFIRGIRKSAHTDIAANYVREWLSGEDQVLLLQIPHTYWGVDEKSLNSQDLEIFEALLDCRVEDKKQKQELDRNIMSIIGWIYKKSPTRIVEIICRLIKRGNQDSIIHHMSQIRRWSREKIDLSQWDMEIFEEIIQKLLELPALDHNAVYILAQYGQKAPLKLVAFFERRVEKQKQMARDSRFQYHPTPHFLKELAELYRDHPQYIEIVNQILRWFQKADYNYDTAAADLISGISPEINDQLRMALSGLIQSASKQNTLAAMKLLERYPDDQISDELYEEIVKHSANDRELQKDIKSKIISVGGGKLQNWRQRLKSWFEGDNVHLREFAQRAIEDLESLIEFNERRTAEDKIKRKKGLL